MCWLMGAVREGERQGSFRRLLGIVRMEGRKVDGWRGMKALTESANYGGFFTVTPYSLNALSNSSTVKVAFESLAAAALHFLGSEPRCDTDGRARWRRWLFGEELLRVEQDEVLEATSSVAKPARTR